MQGRKCFAFTFTQTQTLLQHAAEEMVVAVPAALFVQRHHKQMLLRQVAQPLLSCLALRDRVTQGRAHALQDRRVQQKRLNVCGLASQHFFKQVILHRAMAAAELLDERVSVAAPRQRHGGHLQTCRPRFSAQFEGLNLRLTQPQRHGAVQKGRCFFSIKTQLVLTYLKQLTLSAQTRQCDGRHFA